MSVSFRASGYIYFKKGLREYEIGFVVEQIRDAYLDSDIERDGNHHNIFSVDLFGRKGIDYEPLEKILKDNKEFLDEEVVINEWVETDGGLYFDPEEDEDCSD